MKSKKKTSLVLVLIILLSAIGLFIVYDKVINKDSNDIEEKSNENSSDLTNEERVTNSFKKMYDGLIFEDLKVSFIASDYVNNYMKKTKEYAIDKVEYIDYMSKYKVTYSYTCKNGNGDCLYVGQVTDKVNEKYSASACVRINEDFEITSFSDCSYTRPS